MEPVGKGQVFGLKDCAERVPVRSTSKWAGQGVDKHAISARQRPRKRHARLEGRVGGRGADKTSGRGGGFGVPLPTAYKGVRAWLEERGFEVVVRLTREGGVNEKGKKTEAEEGK